MSKTLLQVQQAHAVRFHQLHGGELLVLANAWDAGSAHLIEKVGAKAIATSSGAQSWAQGFPDGNTLSFEDVLTNVARIVEAVAVPVTADFEGGYAHDPADVAAHTTRLLETGIVGVNFEDSGAKDGVLYSTDSQTARIRAVREAAAAYGVDLFINARTDVFLLAVGDEDGRIDDVIARGRAYKDAGANGLFIPGLLDLDALRTIAEATDLHVNAMWLPGAPDRADLAAAGVARYSAGTAIAQAAYTHAQRAAEAFLSVGDDAALADSIDYFAFNAEFAE